MDRDCVLDSVGSEVRSLDALDRRIEELDAQIRAARRVRRRGERLAVVVVVVVMFLLAALFAPRVFAAETVTYQVTAGFGCSPVCPGSSTPIGAFIAAEANWAQSNQPNHLDSQSLESPTLANGVYTAQGVFHATFGLVAPYTVTGTCTGPCTGDAGDTNGWSSTPKMLQAAIVVGMSSLLFAGIRTGMVR